MKKEGQERSEPEGWEKPRELGEQIMMKGCMVAVKNSSALHTRSLGTERSRLETAVDDLEKKIRTLEIRDEERAKLCS